MLIESPLERAVIFSYPFHRNRRGGKESRINHGSLPVEKKDGGISNDKGNIDGMGLD